MCLFGMMNWLYTWYSPRVDPDAETLAREISDIFFDGCARRRDYGHEAATGSAHSALAEQMNCHPQKKVALRKLRSLRARNTTRQ